MHPRNVYRHINFRELGDEFPELKEYITIDLRGQRHFNFKNIEAVRTLSNILLKRNFNLDVHFPSSRLVPTIPLRLNYILFIEDLLTVVNKNECTIGLDIGTGASCIYPLIAAKKNAWKMVGTDINSDAIDYARQNIVENKLNHLVEVVRVTEGTILQEILNRDSVKYDFCMCNPPFYGSADELCSPFKRKDNRPAPNSAFMAEMHEVLTEGGEVKFVSKIIDESVLFQNRIRIYTSMLGIKRNVKPLLSKLSEMPSIKSTITTEFHQGNTTRFGIAWTFDDTTHLRNPSYNINEKKAKTKPYIHCIRPYNGTIEEVDNKFRIIFNELQFEYNATTENNNGLIYNIVAYSNTWVHSRRKRRELARNTKSTLEVLDVADTKEDICINKANILKRKREELTNNNIKRSKMDKEEWQPKFLESNICVHIGPELKIALLHVDGLGGKDASYQVFQYITNHLNM